MNSFKNIIFDFGGVIISIDYHRTVESFKRAGVRNFDQLYSKLQQDSLFDDFETGAISPEQFRNRLREISGINMSDRQIDDAWNDILLHLPEENLAVLRRLKETSCLFLLSNTNAIHEEAFTRIIIRDFGRNVLPEVFEKIYFSHRIHLRKPHAEVFLHILNENNLKIEETLFVDDSPQHIEGAKAIGLQTLFIDKGKGISDYFGA